MTGFSALAATSTSDAVDSHLELCAHRLQRPVLTGNLDDITRLVPVVQVRRV
jgi:hypothetical protein